jgi:PucR C-terminal helix-turn-helix domain
VVRVLKLAETADIWHVLPAEAAGMLRMESAASITEMVEAIQADVAEYARPLNAAYSMTLRHAVQHAVETFINRVANPDAPLDAIVNDFRGIGFAEAREGRSLEPLQAAMRLGARVAWRRLCTAASEQGLDMLVLGRIGEAIFVYLDELAAASAKGYLDARAEVAGERERRRQRLLNLILADPPASADAVADMAKAAGWALPRRVALVALGERPREDVTSAPVLPPEVLIDWADREPCLLVPDPAGPGRPAYIERALRGWPAAMGPAVPLARASMSLRWARAAAGLAARGVIDGRGRLVRCDEHLSTLLIFSDEELAGALMSARLAPLHRLRPTQQDRLAETLLAWLQHGRNTSEVALRVHVHPQTVRYRLRQADELFGDQLRDPDARFELEIALRARRMLEAGARRAPGSSHR